MSYSTTTRTNISQNQEDFKLSNNPALIFKRGLCNGTSRGEHVGVSGHLFVI